LLPTVTAMMPADADMEKLEARRAKAKLSGKNGNGFGASLNELMKKGLLPTPTTQEPTTIPELTKTGRRKTKDGEDSHSLNLGRMEAMGLIPSPSASDNRNRGDISKPYIQKRLEKGKQVGLTMLVDGQLNPHFVMEMMGFPANWTELPFLIGDKNQSKVEETQ
jgi:hypothetical protein